MTTIMSFLILSLRGVKRRSNLPRTQLEIATAPTGPRNDTKNSFINRPIFFIIALLLNANSLFAQTVTVPHLINFQSVVNGVGGVPLADGIHSVRFRLLNAAQESLYEETQSVESLAGVVSAMIGATVEIPLAVLAPGQARFLGVTAEGADPETVMEIVSAPYALYAEQALQVAPQSIGKEAIIPKSITADLLADDVLQGILPANLVYQSNLDVLKGDYRSAFGAGKIGVDTTFVYSKGPTVQNVLKDFDTALYQRQVNLEKQNTDLTKVIDAKVSSLQTGIGQLRTDFQLADGSLQTQIGTKLATGGGTMSGSLGMGNNRITGAANPSDAQDVATKTYVDTNATALQTQINTKLAAGGGTMSGILNMGLNRITTVAEPISPTDAATRNYVDTKVSGVSTDISTDIDALKAAPKIGGWADFLVNGSGQVTINDSYNVQSIVYSAGAPASITIVWTNPFANEFYSFQATATRTTNHNPAYTNKTAQSVILRNTLDSDFVNSGYSILAVGR